MAVSLAEQQELARKDAVERQGQEERAREEQRRAALLAAQERLAPTIPPLVQGV